MTATLPGVDFDAPAIAEIPLDLLSQDELSDTIKEKLRNNIADGGTMINIQVEADIWARDLERHEQALQDAVDKLTAQWAKLGFSAPDGLLAGSLIAINNEYMNKRLDRSREIAVKQADLEQQGMFKSLELGISYEKIILDSMSDFAKRRLEVAKANGDILIEVYKQRVVLYNTNLERFKTDALVYKTHIEALLSKAEVYKAKIAAQQLVTQINESEVKLYVAKLSGIEQQVNVYNAQIKGAALQYEAEKSKVDIYKAQIDAYTAQIDGMVKSYMGAIEAYKGQVQGAASVNDVTVKNSEVSARVAIAQYESSIKMMEAQARISEVSSQVKMEGLKAAAQTTSNMAAGAMSAIHASVQDSYHISASYNHQYLE